LGVKRILARIEGRGRKDPVVMDGHRLKVRRARRLIFGLLLLAGAEIGCAGLRESGRPVAPFGSVQTYTQTVVPYGARPRGRMVGPPAPGIDLGKNDATIDPAARAVSAR
jgi:hypothetical protein